MSFKLPGETNVGRFWHAYGRLPGKLLTETKEGRRERRMERKKEGMKARKKEGKRRSESTSEGNQRFLYALDRRYIMEITCCFVTTC